MWSDITKRLPGLSAHSRIELDSHVRTLEPLNRLGAELGIDLHVKRDDISTLAFGGNKVRQLEFYLGPAVAQQADTVLITGAIQSNFVRLCAAAAAKLDLQAVVQLEERVPTNDALYMQSGNVLLNQLFGAQIHYFSEGEDEVAADANLDALSMTLHQQGKQPYVIHLGIDHPPIGALGYAVCAVECAMQLDIANQTIDHVVIPSGSGLTHAGFLCGARAIGWNVPVHGICVRRDAIQQQVRIARRASEVMQLLGDPAPIEANDIQVHDAVLAPGYGQLNERVMSAITRCAQSEALLLDPVYTGRTMAGLIDLLETGEIKAGESVLFIHTGGLPALFAYQNQLNEQLGVELVC